MYFQPSQFWCVFSLWFALSPQYYTASIQVNRERERERAPWASIPVFPHKCKFSIIQWKATEVYQSPRIILYEVHFPASLQGLYLRRKQGDPDIFMKHLGRNWQGPGQDGSISWYSPKIHRMTTSVIVWKILTYTDHGWKSMMLLVEYGNWMKFIERSPPPVPFFLPSSEQVLEATAPRIFTRHMKALLGAGGADVTWRMTWCDLNPHICIYIYICMFTYLHIMSLIYQIIPIPNGDNRCNRSGNLIYCHFLVQTCLKIAWTGVLCLHVASALVIVW